MENVCVGFAYGLNILPFLAENIILNSQFNILNYLAAYCEVLCERGIYGITSLYESMSFPSVIFPGISPVISLIEAEGRVYSSSLFSGSGTGIFLFFLLIIIISCG